MVSWAHQRSRELADQLLDDAYTVRQRGVNLIRALGRAAVDVLAAARDAAWIVGDAVGRLFGRRSHFGGPLPPLTPLTVVRAVDDDDF